MSSFNHSYIMAMKSIVHQERLLPPTHNDNAPLIGRRLDTHLGVSNRQDAIIVQGGNAVRKLLKSMNKK